MRRRLRSGTVLHRVGERSHQGKTAVQRASRGLDRSARMRVAGPNGNEDMVLLSLIRKPPATLH